MDKKTNKEKSKGKTELPELLDWNKSNKVKFNKHTINSFYSSTLSH